ncbi:MAG: homoserine dehydrogenase [Solirubrobacteraceae bacterium]
MSDAPAPFRVGLLGHGTVGSAVADLLPGRADAIAHVTGLRPEISGVLTRSRGDFAEILAGSDLIVEVMGGTDAAYDHVTAAIRAGKHVVTANKQLLAEYGEELWGLAREHGVQLRFEAAVAGVVPVIRVLQESLTGQHIDRLHGIVNGTTNFILTQMAATGASYADALAEAQRLGYAEADPSDDVSGKDAAAKMAILARLAFDTPVHLSDVPYEGIEHLTAEDIEYARDLDLSLRLIGTAERVGDELAVRVHPAFLYRGHPLAAVEGSFNAVTVESPSITEITLSGPGAGGPQTATAVIGDVISAMIPPAQTPPTRNTLGFVDDVVSSFYLHVEVVDRPGVLAQIAQVLGLQGVSVKSVVQKGMTPTHPRPSGQGAAPGQPHPARLVLVVHPVLESRFYGAVQMIGSKDFVTAPPRAIRVIDEEFSA